MSHKLNFIALDKANIARLQDNADHLLAGDSEEIQEIKRQVLEVVEQTKAFQENVKASPPWIGYLVVDSEENVIVGSGGFKGNPTPEREVEIAYGVFPPFENRGYATQIARTLTQLAFERGEVKFVIAHTLPERNASGRVLEKSGFKQTREVDDPKDGRTWRWERTR